MGEYTKNNFFYKPHLGARGEDEKNKFDAALDYTDTELADLRDKKHNRVHAINSSEDHTSAIIPGSLIKADDNGLPAEASTNDVLNIIGASSSPQANQIPILNSGGQLSLPFAQVPILVNGQDLMFRTFYVDAVNGNDSNSGTETAPFATIQKAVDSVPFGGYGKIVIIGDYDMDGDEHVSVNYKHIFIELKGVLRSEVSLYSSNSNYASRGGFVLSNSFLEFYVYINSGTYAKIVLDSNTTGRGFVPYYDGFVNVNQYRAYGYVYFDLWNYLDNYNPIVINDSPLVSVSEWSNRRPAFVGVIVTGKGSGNYRHIVVNNGNFVNFKNSPGSVYINYPGGIKDNAGDDISVSSLVTGLVKDTNGVPRNVISNVVL